MTHGADPYFETEAQAPVPTGTGRQALVVLAIVAAKLAVLALLGHDLVCGCGTVLLFQDSFSANGNSQQVSDWYSLLHVSFGLALFVFVDRMRPFWGFGQKLVAAAGGSALWEVAENLPVTISLFHMPEGASAYTGDSLLNSFTDTGFVLAGFLLAARLPLWGTALAAILIEGLVTWRADDGMILGTLRILGLDV